MKQPPSEPFRILVIEDNGADVALLRMSFTSAGLPFEMTVITDGAEALTHFSQMSKSVSKVPDIVVLDLNLPKYDGLEILEAVRAFPAVNEVPIAILTSSSSPRERARIEMFPLVRYLTKPSDLPQYLMIGSHIRDFIMETRSKKNAAAE